MNFKKIVAVVSSLALSATMFASMTVSAAITAAKPNITLTYGEYEVVEDSGTTYYDITVTINQSGFEGYVAHTSSGRPPKSTVTGIMSYNHAMAVTNGFYEYAAADGFGTASSNAKKVAWSAGGFDTYITQDCSLGSYTIETTDPDAGTTFSLAEFAMCIAEVTSGVAANDLQLSQNDYNFSIEIPSYNEMNKPAAEVTSIEIAGADTVEAEATATYTATVKDADGAEMADETVTWSIQEDTTAATIDAATGVLTAGKPDADTTVTVVATSATKADVSAKKTVTISKYVARVVDPTIELTAEEGKDSAAGAYTFFYKAVITAGTEAITAADVTITSGHQSRRAFLSEDMLANIGGGITFYVGNKTADAGRAFSAVGTVNGIASDAVEYTTPAE